MATSIPPTATVYPTPLFTSSGGNPSFIEGYGDDYWNCPKTHSLATAAGVGVGAGVLAATIIILAFVLIRRRQSRARRALPTISPNVLVTGPMTHEKHEWEEHHEQPKGLDKSGGSVKYKEPPMYTKSI